MLSLYNDIELVALKLVDGLPLNTARIMDEYHFCGSRVSGKTRSIVECIVKAHIVAVKEGKRVLTHAFRNMNKDVEDSIFGEIRQELKRTNAIFKENRKAMSFTLGEDSIIYCRGLHTQTDKEVKLSGLQGSNNADLVIKGYEEAFEISKTDRQAVNEAIRDAQSVIEFNSCNPGLYQNHYIQFLDRRMRFDETELGNKYFQKVNLRERIVDKKTSQEFFIKRQLIYSNGRINTFITPLDKMKMLDLESSDPKRARVASLGMPGAEIGAIFSAYMDNVKEVDGVPYIEEFRGGIDYGERVSATTAGLGARNNNFFKFGKLEEGFHSNHDFGLNNDKFGTMSPLELAKQVVLQIKSWGERYPRMKYQRGGVEFYVDNSASAGMANLKMYAIDLGLTGVHFKRSVKLEEYLRIDFIRNLMSEGRGYMNKNCVAGLREYDTMIGDPRKMDSSEPKALDKDNHTFDADCYAIQGGMKKARDNAKNNLLYQNRGYGV